MKRYFFFFLLVSAMMVMFACTPKEYVHVGPNWDALYKMKPEQNAFKVEAVGTQKAKIGEEISFKVKSEKSGKLWIVQADANDSMTILFPNAEMKNNKISGGVRVHIPPQDAQWNMTATKPEGQSVVAFIVTTGKANISDILAIAKKNTEKSISVGKSSRWGLAKLIIDIE